MNGANLHSGNPGRKLPSAQLSAKLDRKLIAYATTASAAGVTLLAQSAEAKVVYTPADIQIAANQNFSLDLNNDGIRDFILSRFEHEGYGLAVEPTRLRPQNAIWAQSNSAAALSSGVTVGPSSPFKAGRLFLLADSCRSGCQTFGPWYQAQDKYLGLSFVVDGKVHYGWARMNVGLKGQTSVVIGVVTGYAYETEPDTPIVTGQKESASAAAPQIFMQQEQQMESPVWGF